MVIRKPYAFLIKNFKIIHLLLFALLTFILIKYTGLFGFFNDYARNGFYTYQANIQEFYVGFPILISIILVLASGIIVYLLLKWKDKPTRFYIVMCAYYIVIFIILMICFGVMNASTLNNLNVRTVRAYRDIIGITMVPQYFFVVFSLIRGIGFDIKQFEFKKDLEELEIDTEDDEEIELVVVKDTYKIPRFFRKMFRNIKYFVLEKKFIASLIVIVLSAGIGVYVYVNSIVYKDEYKETETFTINSLTMKVIESYNTNIDYKGIFVNEGKNYLIIKINVVNGTPVARRIETDKFILILGNEKLSPVFTKKNNFLDLGESYSKETIAPAEDKDVLLVYEIDDKMKVSTLRLKVLNEVRIEGTELDAQYKEIILEPRNLSNVGIIDEFKLGDEILFGDSALKKTSLIVNSYEMSNSFEEPFKFKAGNINIDAIKIIKPDIVGKSEKVIIKLTTSSVIDKEINMFKYVKNSSNLFKYFGSIKYTVNGIEKTKGINVISYSFINNSNVYMEVPVEVKNATKIELFLTVRDNKYGIILK